MLFCSSHALLDPIAVDIYADPDEVAHDGVATLRAYGGTNPHDKTLIDLVGELSVRSRHFRRLWAALPPAAHTRRTATRWCARRRHGTGTVLGPGFRLTYMTGLRAAARGWLADVASGAMRYHGMRDIDVAAEIAGETSS